MLILKLNIDPAGPELELDYRMFGQRSTVPVVGLSPNDMPVLGMNDYVAFQARDGINNSVALSEELLQTYLDITTRFGKQKILKRINLK